MKKRLALLALLLFAGALRQLFYTSEDFSELYVLYVAPFFRLPLTFLSSLFPFSLFESAVGIAIILAPFFVWAVFKKRYRTKVLKTLLIFFIFVFLAFVFVFEASYYRKPIDETVGLKKAEMSADTVASSLRKVLREADELDIHFTPSEPTSLPMSFGELSRELDRAAEKVAEKYGYLQKIGGRAKPLAFGELLAYTGISGLYSFFTGEANINTAFADYSLPFTVAHELSHLRGVGHENEAEFSALLICLESDEPYIRYSAYSQAAITLSNLLYEYDEKLFYEVLDEYPTVLFSDVYFSSKSYEKYSSTPIDEISSAINDTYLKLNGDEGVVSYSLAAELYVAYFYEEEK